MFSTIHVDPAVALAYLCMLHEPATEIKQIEDLLANIVQTYRSVHVGAKAGVISQLAPVVRPPHIHLHTNNISSQTSPLKITYRRTITIELTRIPDGNRILAGIFFVGAKLSPPTLHWVRHIGPVPERIIVLSAAFPVTDIGGVAPPHGVAGGGELVGAELETLVGLCAALVALGGVDEGGIAGPEGK